MAVELETASINAESLETQVQRLEKEKRELDQGKPLLLLHNKKSYRIII